MLYFSTIFIFYLLLFSKKRKKKMYKIPLSPLARTPRPSPMATSPTRSPSALTRVRYGICFIFLFIFSYQIYFPFFIFLLFPPPPPKKKKKERKRKRNLQSSTVAASSNPQPQSNGYQSNQKPKSTYYRYVLFCFVFSLKYLLFLEHLEFKSTYYRSGEVFYFPTFFQRKKICKNSTKYNIND